MAWRSVRKQPAGVPNLLTPKPSEKPSKSAMVVEKPSVVPPIAPRLSTSSSQVPPFETKDLPHEEDEPIDLVRTPRDDEEFEAPPPIKEAPVFVLDSNRIVSSVDVAFQEADGFDPLRFVAQTIAVKGDGTTKEDMTAEIDELQFTLHEVDDKIAYYINEHYQDFNSLIGQFSEMILSVSNAQESINGLKSKVAQVVVGLDTHASEVQLLRARVGKAIIMVEILESIGTFLVTLRNVKGLVGNNHFFAAAVEGTRLRSNMCSNQFSQCMKPLINSLDVLLTTLHKNILTFLADSVFRVGLYENGVEAWSYLHNVSSGVATVHDASTAPKEHKRVTLECVKGLALLGKEEDVYAVLVHRSDSAIRSHFAKVASACSEALLSDTSRANSEHISQSAAILCDPDFTSFPEAVSLVQERQLRKFFTVLYAEARKILRNFDVASKAVVCVKQPMLESFLGSDEQFRSAKFWNLNLIELHNQNDIDAVMGILQSNLRIPLPHIEYPDLVRQRFPITVKEFIASVKEALHDTQLQPNWETLLRHAAGLWVEREVVDGSLRLWSLPALWSQISEHITPYMRCICEAGSEDMPLNVSVDDEDADTTYLTSLRKDLSVPPASSVFPSLGELLRSSSNGAFEFLEQIGQVSYSPFLAGKRQRGIVRGSASTSLRPLSNESEQTILKRLRSIFVPSPFNAIPAASVLGEVAQAIGVYLPSLSNTIQKNDYLLGFLRAVCGSQLQQYHLRNVAKLLPPVLEFPMFGYFEENSIIPTLSIVPTLEKLIEKVDQLVPSLPADAAANLYASALYPVVEMCLTSLKVYWGSLCTPQLAAFQLLHTAFEDAFQYKPSTLWSLLTDETKITEAHQWLDDALFKLYEKANTARTSGYACPTPEPITTTAATSKSSAAPLPIKKPTVTEESIQQFVVGEEALKTLDQYLPDEKILLACVCCMSLESLHYTFLKRFILFSASQIKSDATENSELLQHAVRSGIPGSLSFAALSQLVDFDSVPDAARRWLSLSRQAAILSAAFFLVLVIEAKIAAFRFIPQLRDEAYAQSAESGLPDAFVSALIGRIGKILLIVEGVLPASKRRLIAMGTARPISELFLQELPKMRSKEITLYGQRQLLCNLQAIQSRLYTQFPDDLEYRSVIKQALRRPFFFIANLRNLSLTEQISNMGSHQVSSALSSAELESLLAFAFREESSDDLGREMYRLRNFLIESKQSSTARDLLSPPL